MVSLIYYRSVGTQEGAAEKLSILNAIFPEVGQQLGRRPAGVGKDEPLDTARAAWAALR